MGTVLEGGKPERIAGQMFGASLSVKDIAQ